MYQNQNTELDGAVATVGNPAASNTDPTLHQQEAQLNINFNGMQQQQQPLQQQQQPQQQGTNISRNVRKKPYVKITEQPAGKAMRFRYECEGRSAGSIPGVNSTPENKTYPTIEIVGYKGRAVVVVSCVTKDQPHRPHPHNLVGKEGCKKGVCTLEINSETMRAVFSNLGIQCVKKKDIESALKAREDIRVDPYKTGFSHASQPSSIDLNSVRLCFQVFMESDQKGRFTQPLAPVISDPIYDKKAMSDLVICRMCTCSASVLGNTQNMLFCEKVAKEDIALRFYEEKNGQVVWEAQGEFQHSDVHKQTAIAFKTPRYHTIDITEPAKVFIQLRRPSDGVTSEPLPFEYIPLDSGRHTYWNMRRNLKRKPDLDIFQQILAINNDIKPTEVIDLNTPTVEEKCVEADVDAEAFKVVSHQVIEDEAAKRRCEHEIDTIIDEKVRELEQLQQQQQQQQQEQQQQQQNTVQQVQQESEETFPVETEVPLSTSEKINEWMNSNELEQTNIVENVAALNVNEHIQCPNSTVATTDEDRTLNDLLEQVAELDEIYTDHNLRHDNYNKNIINELSGMDACEPDNNNVVADGGQTAMDIDDNFDDAATYTSLQLAFKNPVAIKMDDIMPPTPPASNLAPEDAPHYDHVEVLAYPAAQTMQIDDTQLPQSPPRPAPPHFSSPHMHVTAAEEEKLPPLPPKRIRKQDSNAENRSIEANSGDISPERKHTPIIIKKTPDQSPPTKRLPPRPGSNTLPKQKKPGFFAKLFSRRKSKSDLTQTSEQNSLQGSKLQTPSESREGSLGHFQLNDPKRSSVRSVKSLQPISLPSSPERNAALQKGPKVGKPVGRSVSSVSGKRPARLNADVIHIPLKGGDSYNSLPQHEAYSNSSTITLGNTLDRRTVSALQLADIPICDGNMELVAIADRQSLRNLCEGEFNVQLDPDVDLTEAEHYALYTSIPPQATVSEFDETSAYYAAVDAGEILTPDELARRLTAANNHPDHLRRKRQKTGGDPMHFLLQQQQQQKQPQSNHQDGRQGNNLASWHAPNIPPIKTEPRDASPQSYSLHRAPPELTPSPQPLSPANNYNQNNSPSPYSVAGTVGTPGGVVNVNVGSGSGNGGTGGGGGGGVGGGVGPPVNAQHVLSTAHQYDVAGGGMHASLTPMDMQSYNVFAQQQQPQQEQRLPHTHHHHQQQQQQQQPHQHQQQQNFQYNILRGAGTHWEEKIAAAAAAANAASISNLNYSNTLHNHLAASAAAGGGPPPHWNQLSTQMHLQQQQQQQQHHLQQQQQLQLQAYQTQAANESPNNAVPMEIAPINNNNNNNNNDNGATLSNLLNFDSEQLVRINSEDQQMLRLNSEDLQISNLSIST